MASRQERSLSSLGVHELRGCGSRRVAVGHPPNLAVVARLVVLSYNGLPSAMAICSRPLIANATDLLAEGG
jgi:hypothetical protein